jgi:hypothetical protein
MARSVAPSERPRAGRNPLRRYRPRLPPLGPPKRLFDFVRDVAPGDADIVQVALGPACEFPAIAITLPPEMKDLREHRRQPDCLLAGQLLDDSLDIRGDQAC